MRTDNFPVHLRNKKVLFIIGLVIIIGIVLLAGMILPKEHSVSNHYIIPAGTFSPGPVAETTFAYPPGMVIYSFGPATLRPQDVGLNTTDELNSRLEKIADDSDRELDNYFYPNGSVISFGYDLFGTMVVGVNKEQGINQSTVTEIYQIIERNGEKNGIKNIPCKFLSMGMIKLDIGKNPAKPGSESRLPGMDSGYFTNHTPIEYLDELRAHPGKPVMVLPASDGWITLRDAEQLMQLIDSEEPAAPVVSPLSSYLPINETSTVGNEAMFLLEGYRIGHYPPALSSVYYFMSNRTEMRAWWDADGKKGLLDEKAAIRTVQDAYPDLFAYPSENFPVKSIITQKSPSGWYLAFIMEGSGVPIVSARCYYVGNDRMIRETNTSHGVMVMPQDFSAETCG